MFSWVQVTCGSLVGKWTKIKCHKYPWNEQGSEQSSDPLVLFFIGTWGADWTELDISRNFYWIYLKSFAWTTQYVVKNGRSLYISTYSYQWFHFHDAYVKPWFAKLCIMIDPFPHLTQVNASQKIFVSCSLLAPSGRLFRGRGDIRESEWFSSLTSSSIS